MFKVFFSWQSDLSNSKTRGFIRECIDEANDYAGEAEAMKGGVIVCKNKQACTST